MTTRWPYPGDSVLTRTRKVAWAYRALAEKLSGDDTTLLDELDERIRSWDEGWIAPKKVYHPDDWVPAKEAIDVAGIADASVSKARINGRIQGRRDGKRFMYRVGDLWGLAATMRRRNTTQQSRVPDNGRSVSDERTDE